MAAHDELNLLAKLIKVGDLRPLKEARIDVHHFKTDHGLAIFNRIIEYTQNKHTLGYIPTREFLEAEFPTIDLPTPPKQDFQIVLADFKTYWIKEELMRMSDYMMSYRHEPEATLKRVHTDVKVLCKQHRITEDVVVSKSATNAYDAYIASMDPDAMHGIPWPWETLNEETGGIREHDFVVLYGRPKSMKTWLLLNIAVHAYDTASRRVLVYTREMTPKQMLDRSMCLLIGAPYAAFRKRLLHEIPVEEGGTMLDRYRELAKNMVADEDVCSLETGFNKCLIITSDREDPTGGGVSGLRQKAEDHKVDLICADALYLMRSEKHNKASVKWEDIADISRALRDMTLDLRKPLIGTVQANRGAEKERGKSATNIAHTDALAQDSDLAIEVNKRRLDDENNELYLAIPIAREMNLGGFAIHGNAASDFSQIYVPVKDQAGVAQTDSDGQRLYEPMIFKDSGDVQELFKKFDPEDDRKPNTGPDFKRNKKVVSEMALNAMRKGKRS